MRGEKTFFEERAYLTSIIFIILLISPVMASANFTISLDNLGTATFTGKESNLTSNLPNGVGFYNGSIAGSTTFLTRKTGDVWTFSFVFPDSDIKVSLPKGATVGNVVGEISLVENLFVAHGKNNVYVSYKLNETIAQESINVQNKDSPYLGAKLAFIIMFILILFLGYIFIRNKRWKRIKLTKNHTNKKVKSKIQETKKFELLEQILNSKENQILKIIREKGKMKSSYLQRISQIPKSSFFRNIQELEKKKLIVRSGPGRNRFIELVKK